LALQTGATVINIPKEIPSTLQPPNPTNKLFWDNIHTDDWDEWRTTQGYIQQYPGWHRTDQLAGKKAQFIIFHTIQQATDAMEELTCQGQKKQRTRNIRYSIQGHVFEKHSYTTHQQNHQPRYPPKQLPTPPPLPPPPAPPPPLAPTQSKARSTKGPMRLKSRGSDDMKKEDWQEGDQQEKSTGWYQGGKNTKKRQLPQRYHGLLRSGDAREGGMPLLQVLQGL
jgi:hypothetical protein